MKQLTVPSDLRIRPYGLADRARVLRMPDRLSSDSLYTRFSAGTPRLPRHYLTLLDGLDHWDREAMVALDADEIVAIAEYIRHRRRPRCADIAVLVTDPWQRLGIGSLLVAYLAELAGRRGIVGFDADVVPTNTGAVRLIRRGWPAVRSTWEGGFAHFHLPLPVRTRGPARSRARLNRS